LHQPKRERIRKNQYSKNETEILDRTGDYTRVNKIESCRCRAARLPARRFRLMQRIDVSINMGQATAHSNKNVLFLSFIPDPN
jgi:hypothetical protein